LVLVWKKISLYATGISTSLNGIKKSKQMEIWSLSILKNSENFEYLNKFIIKGKKWGWIILYSVQCSAFVEDLNKEGARGTLSKYYNEYEEYNISITRNGYNNKILLFCALLYTMYDYNHI